MNTIIEQGNNYFVSTYAQFPIVLTGGKGVYVTDIEGKVYLDMVAGIAVNALGYQDKEFNDTLKKVIDNGLLHCSNLYYNEYATKGASLLCELSGMDKVFFCNSGTEANEAALKLSRKYGKNFDTVKDQVITMESSFHGRTYGSMSLTGQVKYQKSFTPLVPHIVHTPLNDFEALKKNVNPSTCAIFVEVIQGEGGVKCADPLFLQKVRTLCDEQEILLVFDEVQCGIGRTGKAFAWQHTHVMPDIMTIAKALGNGVPIGAMLVKGRADHQFKPGDHAATFGGNLLSTAAASIVLERVKEGALLHHVQKVGTYFKEQLLLLKDNFPQIVDVRGMGLMLGIELNKEVKPIIDECIKQGMLIVGAGLQVIRFVPPLTISKSEVDEGIAILKRALEKVGI